jgi:hypothetical protein
VNDGRNLCTKIDGEIICLSSIEKNIMYK